MAKKGQVTPTLMGAIMPLTHRLQQSIYFLTHTKKNPQKRSKILAGRHTKILSSLCSIIQLAKCITSGAESQRLPAENCIMLVLTPTWPDPAQRCGTWYLHRAERSSLALAPYPLINMKHHLSVWFQKSTLKGSEAYWNALQITLYFCD